MKMIRKPFVLDVTDTTGIPLVLKESVLSALRSMMFLTMGPKRIRITMEVWK